ncbi:hypothetical protein HHK36_016576 [Tetracentron sinense]|uniref:PB1 domain-containing protein n=1 Tax=Tetracentron sinense TaxID=13715 RepID=A0A834Z5J5_TETSI|nr:hypothetical protein HHK36_016576 [Tetracentron sinense]
MSIPSAPRMKKLRTSLQPTSPNYPVTAGRGGFLDFEESVRSSKVLQGQENVGFVSQHYGSDKVNHPLHLEMHNPAQQSLISAGLEESSISESIRAQSTQAGIAESVRLQKVLQGQEICPLRSFPGTAEFDLGAWEKSGLGCNMFNMYQIPKPNFFPFSSGIGNMYVPFSNIYKTSHDPVILQPDMSSVLTRPPGIIRGEDCNPGSHNLVKEQTPPENFSAPATNGTSAKDGKDEVWNGTKTGCKLFGFSLTGETPTAYSQSSSRRSCTKVHKQGNLVGRAVDLSRLNGYNDLLSELERLFNMEGLLCDLEEGWRVLYTDGDNDMMAVGDDPWHEFCNIVSKIHIYTEEEVEKMTNGMISEDTQSCLEEATAIMDV